MKYRIEYTDGKHCSFADGSKDLIRQLKKLSNDDVSDVRKLFKSGVSDSVMDIYKKYIGHGKEALWGIKDCGV